jgi:pilus assembly protein CpaB
MRKFGIFVVVILAIAFAVAASGLTYIYLRNASEERGLTLQAVVVADKDLTFGETLKPDDMKVAMFPKSGVPKGSYAVKDSLLGQVTKVFLMENEPILDSKLSSKGGGLSLLISPTKRAASILVDKVSGVSGFILPGDRVDVILTVNRLEGDSRDAIAKTILQNVEVLAAGEKTEEQGNKVITVQSVTLLVDPDGAQALALATNEGKLNLALRNPTDEDTSAVEPLTKSGILKGEKEQKPQPKVVVRVKEVPTKPPEKPDSVIMIKGATKKTEAPAMPEEKEEKK